MKVQRGLAWGHGRRLTLIGALALDGIRAAMTVTGATSTAVFLAFVTQVLIPALKSTRPDAVVVMDNLAARKAAAVRRALDQAEVSYRYLPAYSPNMNPIEQAWSKLKTHLRQGGPNPGRPRTRHPPSPRNRHPQQCPRMVPPRRLPAKPTRIPL